MTNFRESLTIALLFWIWHEQLEDRLLKLLTAVTAFGWTIAAVVELMRSLI